MDIYQSRAVGPGYNTQHLHQTAHSLVADSAAVPGCQCWNRPVGVTLEQGERTERNVRWSN